MAAKITSNTAMDLARYFLYRANFDGDTITPLKMQKLIYFAYIWVLVKKNKKLFDEKFQAWPNGPVLKSLYDKLKHLKGSSIDISFTGLKNEKDLEELIKSFPPGTIEIIDKVYEHYITKSAFELVTLTHNGKPWKSAREGLTATEHSSNEISDEDILAEYGKK